MSSVLSVHDSGLAILTLNEADNGNRLTPRLLADLDDALSEALTSAAVRVVLLRSAGPRFCEGMDLSLLPSAGADTEPVRRSLQRAISMYSRLLARIYECSKPVVCVAGGPVKAGGVGLLCACDAVYAAEETSIELGEVLFGLIPANVMPYLLGQRVPPQKARYLALSAKTLNAAEAQALGIVDEVVPASDMNRALKRFVKQLMRSSPAALAQVKRFTAQAAKQTRDDFRFAAKKALEELAMSDDVRAAIQAYASGETPEWFARFKPEHTLFENEGDPP